MAYKASDVLEEARVARDEANAFFDKALAESNTEMIKISIDLCQKAEEKFIIAERHLRQKELRMHLEESDLADMKHAEGKRKFFVNQFNGLTGQDIK